MYGSVCPTDGYLPRFYGTGTSGPDSFAQAFDFIDKYERLKGRTD